MNKYQEQKDQAREKAQAWQIETSIKATSYKELAEAQTVFEKLGKKYGLLKEFRDNGIL